MSAHIVISTRPASVSVWWLAIRPKTLSLSWVPVLVGCSLAWQEQGHIAWLGAILALLAAVLIQIGTNLHNDAKDFERGVDSADGTDRQGPPRVTAMGWLTAAAVRNAAYGAFGLAFVLGLYLMWVGGIFIITLGLLSIASGLAYTGGPKPIAYGSLGEVFVFLFFGIGAVVGTYYLNTGHISWSALAIGAALGFLAAAVLVVNNYRDLERDQAVGKVTLAIRIGQQATRFEYAFLLLMPFMLVVPISINWPLVLLTWLALPLAIWLIIQLFKTPPSPICNNLLARTAQLQLVFGILLIIGHLIYNCILLTAVTNC